MNTPNRLTLFRILLIPAIIVFCVYDFFGFDDGYADWLGRAVSCGLFLIAAVTDFLDGFIARKHNLVTDFGKFMDPLADKFLVLGCLFSICFSRYLFGDGIYTHSYAIPSDVLKTMLFWASIIVLFRELAVTSMRLVIAKRGVVVPAHMLGKIKTNAQMICIVAAIAEPVVLPFAGGWITAVTILAMAVFTVWSGIHYLATYWKYLDVSI